MQAPGGRFDGRGRDSLEIVPHDYQAEEQLKARIMPGNGEMATMMRERDWSRTPLGPVKSWPLSLRTAVSICLTSRFPIVLWCGPELRLLYNDAWRPVLGAMKHPAALGAPGKEVWPEIWDTIGPMLHGVLLSGRATWEDDQLLVLERNGYAEEAYFTYSYSPIHLEDGSVGGVFSAVHETTQTVLGQRRLQTLRTLGGQTSHAKSDQEACQLAIDALQENPADVPFAALYLIGSNGDRAELHASTHAITSAPASVELSERANDANPFMQVLALNACILINDAEARYGRINGLLSLPTREALILPLRSALQEKMTGFLVAGINPAHALDEEYRNFFEVMATHIATGIANARAYAEERKRAEALAELDRAKTTFFGNVSHEFRTPLTLMLGPTEDALASPQKALSGTELERVHRNQLRLLKLVNTLLDFSRLEAGRVKARFTPTDLSAFTTELVSVFRSAMERAGLTFIVDCPPLANPVHVDREMWEKVVLNLLSNALKSTFEGAIVVKLHAVDGHVELAIRDTGTGIPQNEIPHLFERFRRIEGARRRTHEGSGIGLALVYELVKMHGGSISVQSALGKGTTFTIAIPFGSSHLPPQQISAPDAAGSSGSGRIAFLQEALSWLPGEQSSPGAIYEAGEPGDLDSIGALAGTTEMAGGRVLLVDDNRDMLEYVQRLLSSRFSVVTAANGRLALEMALKSPPELVLSDVMMPEMDGFQLLSALRANASTAAIPVILLSARAGEDSHVEGMEAGADDYLIKPFTARELLARVDAHLKIARFRRKALEHEAELQREMEDAHRLAAEAVEHISDGFCILDSNWRITYVNPAGERIAAAVGASDNLIGSSLWQNFPDLLGTEIEHQYRRCMDQRIPVAFESVYGQRWYSLRAHPAPGEGIVIYSADITARRKAELALRLKQEHLLLTQKAAGIGAWELDMDEEELLISPEFASIAGLPSYVSRLRYSDFLSALFLSSDRLQAEDTLRKALRSSKEFSMELRLKRPDGAVRLVSNRGKVFYNQGKPTVLGVLVDITPQESKKLPERLSRKRAPMARQKSRQKPGKAH